MSYAIINTKQNTYLNNIQIFMGRIVDVNFIDIKACCENKNRLVSFSSEEDAQSLSERIMASKFTKVKTKVVPI